MEQKNRRWKYGALAAVITVLGIVLIVAVNVIAEQLTEKLGWSVDLTADGRYAISEDTIQYLKGLDKEVKITVLVDEEDMASGSYYLVQAYQNLMEYEQNSDKVKVEFVDVIDNPTFTAGYADLDLSAYDILVESGDKQEVLAIQDLYTYNDAGTQITASKVEQMLTSAIAEVVSDEKTKIVVLSGYGENEPDGLRELLEANQYEVKSQQVLTEEIDEDAAAAILFAPQTDLEESTLEKLSKWLDNDGQQGRNLLVFLDPNVAQLPNLESYLNEWGIALGEGYAFEASSSLYYEKFYYPVAQYSDMEYAAGMTSTDLTIMALCRPVDVLFEEQNNYKTSVLLGFSPTSGVVKLGETKVTSDMVTGDVKGMVLSTHSWYGSEITESSILVSGSALAFSQGLVNGSGFANGDYILGVIQKLCGRSGGMNIPVKNLTSETHTMSGARANAYTWVFMIVIPVLVAAAGVAMWIRRRHR